MKYKNMLSIIGIFFILCMPYSFAITIYDPFDTDLESDSVKIRWYTQQDADEAYVEYGVSQASLEKTYADEEEYPTSDHSVELEDLSPGQDYVYRVAVQDSSGQIHETGFDYNFTTLPAVPENLNIIDVDYNSAELEWDSSGGGQKYEVFLDDQSMGNTSGSSYELTGLNPETNYEVYVIAYDSKDRASEESDEVTFGTTGEPANLDSIEVSQITEASANVTWTTDKDVESLIRYGKNTELENEIEEGVSTTQHEIELEGLEPDTLYYYKVYADDQESDMKEFTTLVDDSDDDSDDSDDNSDDSDDVDDIDISDVNVVDIDTDKATISWKTNALVESDIKYGDNEDEIDDIIEGSDAKTEHEVELTGLLSGTEYYFSIHADDAQTSVDSFTTAQSEAEFLELDDLMDLTNEEEINVSGRSAVNSRLYIIVNDESHAQVRRESIEGTTFNFPVKLSSGVSYDEVEGKNKITVRAWDSDGNRDELTDYVVYDPVPPALDIDSLPSLIAEEKVTVEGNSEKGASIEFRVNNETRTTISELEEESFSEELRLGNTGEYEIKIIAEDEAGNKANFSEAVEVDTESPSAEFDNDFGETHFKIYKISGETRPNSEISVVNWGIFDGCDEAAISMDFTDCDDFLSHQRSRFQVDPVAAVMGVERTTTADSDGEFQVDVPLMRDKDNLDAERHRNKLEINITSRAGNEKRYTKKVDYTPGCDDWKIGSIESFPFNIYTRDLTSGDIEASSFFPVKYVGPGEPEVLNVYVGEDNADLTGLADDEIQDAMPGSMGDDDMESGNEYMSFGNAQATQYNPSEGAFNVYAPITINQYRGSTENLPDTLRAYMAVEITYEGPDGKGSCHVYPRVAFDVHKPEDTTKWLSPEQINKSIEFLNETIQYTEDTAEVARMASYTGLLACGAMTVWQYLSGIGGGSDDDKCDESMEKVYYICDRVLCPSAPPDCGEFEPRGSYEMVEEDGRSQRINGTEYKERLGHNAQWRQTYDEYRDEGGEKSWEQFSEMDSKDAEGHLEGYEIDAPDNDYSKLNTPEFQTSVSERSLFRGTQEKHSSIEFVEVDERGRLQEGAPYESLRHEDGEKYEIYISLERELQKEAERCKGGTLVISRTTGDVGPSDPGLHKEAVTEEGHAVSCRPESTDELLNDSAFAEEGEVDTSVLSGCYDESCPQFDGTKCPRWFSFSDVGEGGSKGHAGINPPEGLWSSLKCVCLPAITQHLENYIKIMKGAKKCLQQAQIGEVRGGFCERLLAQFICDLLIESLKFILHIDDRSTGAGTGDDEARGAISDYRDHHDQVTDQLSDRYGGVAQERFGLSSEQLVHKACVFGITQDWSMLEGIFENYVDTFDVEPVAKVSGQSRPYGFDPFTGTMSINYNIFVGLVAGGDTDVSLWLECDREAAGGEYCGEVGPEPKDISDRLGDTRLTSQSQPLNQNVVYLDKNARFWYNKVVLHLDYTVGDESKTKTLEQEIWRKGDLAAQCTLDPTEGIQCSGHEGFGARDGTVWLTPFSGEPTRLTPEYKMGGYAPDNPVSAFVKLNSQFRGQAYLRFDFGDDTSSIEYPVEGQQTESGKTQVSGHSKEGGDYYNLYLSTVEAGESQGQKNDGSISFDNDPLPLEIDKKESNISFVDIEKIKFKLDCQVELEGGDSEETVFEFEEEDLENGDEYEINCLEGLDDDDVDNVKTVEIRKITVLSGSTGKGDFRQKNFVDKNPAIKIDEDGGGNWVKFTIPTDDNGGAGERSSNNVEMNVLEDTSGDDKGDTVIPGEDGEDQSSTTDYKIALGDTEEDPTIDFLQPVKDTFPEDKEIPIGFNVWTSSNEIEEIRVLVDGVGHQVKDMYCDYVIDKEGIEMENGEDCIFEASKGRLGHNLTRGRFKAPPFYEVLLEWDTEDDKYSASNEQYSVKIDVKDKHGKTAEVERRFYVTRTDVGERQLSTRDYMVWIGGRQSDLSNCDRKCVSYSYTNIDAQEHDGGTPDARDQEGEQSEPDEDFNGEDYAPDDPSIIPNPKS